MEIGQAQEIDQMECRSKNKPPGEVPHMGNSNHDLRKRQPISNVH
jgi:hypothetical protein